VVDPALLNFGGHTVFSQHLPQNLHSAGKVPTSNRVGRMGLPQRPAAVRVRPAQERARVLELEALDAVLVGRHEEKADHQIVEHAVDEIVDHGAELLLAAQLLVQSFGHDDL
jgi:hypothetical protein